MAEEFGWRLAAWRASAARAVDWLAGSPSPYADLARATIVWLATRAALALFVYLAGQHYECSGPRCTDRRFFPDNIVLNALFQWDALQFSSVIRHGYYTGAGFITTAPYFPGFPLLAWLVGKLVGSPLLGGILLNNVSAILAAALMAQLVRRLGVAAAGSDPDRTAREATLFWLASPLTLFFSVFLSEAFFGLAAVGLLWAVATGCWPVALAAGVAATATRSAGVLVVAAAALLAWERRDRTPVPWWGWACVLSGFAGLAAFVLYQHVALGDAWAWVHVQERWDRMLVWPWRTVADWVGLPPIGGGSADPSPLRIDRMYQTQELIALAVTAPLLFLRARLRIPRSVWLLGIGIWLLPLLGNSLISSARYQAGNIYFAMAIPALIAHRPLVRGLVWMLFGMVLAWYASTFSMGNWAT